MLGSQKDDVMFDVFISFKNHDKSGRTTRDSVLAREVYAYLSARGYRVFLSPNSLEKLGASDFKRAIDKALECSRVLVAVGTSAENLDAGWVRYEWDTFHSDILNGLKPDGRVFAYIEGCKPSTLPRPLRHLEVFEHVGAGLEKLARSVASLLPSYEDATWNLGNLPHTKNTNDLIDIIRCYPYTFETMITLRDCANRTRRPNRLLHMVSDAIIQLWNEEPVATSVLSTLLSTNHQQWEPRKDHLKKLASLCTKEIKHGNSALIASAEPLAFALLAKDKGKAHRQILERRVRDPSWQADDAIREGHFYPNLGAELEAIHYHTFFASRKGIQRANDCGRLIYLLLANQHRLGKHHINLLITHIEILRDCNEMGLASQAQAVVKSLRLPSSNK